MTKYMDLNHTPVNFKDDKWFNLDSGRFTTFVITNDFIVVTTKILKTGTYVKFRNFGDIFYNITLQIYGSENAIMYFDYLNCVPDNIQITQEDTDRLNSIDPDSLCNFGLKNLLCVCKVVNVVDGDTIDILFHTTLSELSALSTKRTRSKGVCCMKNCHVEDTTLNTNITIRKRCRLYGIDTTEKHTEKGKEDKMLVTELLLNKMFKCRILKDGKYGTRSIIILYDESNININKRIEILTDCHEYYGGTKSF